MESKAQQKDENKKTWISLTGYRTLYVLKLLLEKSRTIDELVELLKSNPYTNKSVSKDTVRITINTLRAAGCDISGLDKKSNFKYILYSHPFVLEFTDSEIDALVKLRKNAIDNLSWDKILVVNDLFDKVTALTKNEEQINLLDSTKIFSDINKDVLYKLANPSVMNKRITIKYLSPKHGEEVFDIIVGKISFTEGKLYLSCFNYKYDSKSLLNIERIKEIISIHLKEEKIQKYVYEVEYELFGDSFLNYEQEEYETIIERNNNSLIIKAVVENEFSFVQRMLLFGADFKIISPDSFREKLVNKIKLIQRGYEDA